MSLFPGSTWLGGYGWWPVPYAEEGKAVPAQPVKPKDPIDRKGLPPGGVGRGEWPYQGYSKAPAGTAATYAVMSRHPTITKAYGIITHAILAGTRGVKIRPREGGEAIAYKPKPIVGDGVVTSPEDRKAELLHETFARLWSYVLSASCRSLLYGHSLMEVDWTRKADATVITGFRRFKPGEATLLEYPKGVFVGFKAGQETRDARYAFNCVNQPDEEPLFGFPNNENCREEWWEKILGKIEGMRLDHKASSIVAVVKGPANDAGLTQSKAIAAAIERGETVYMPQYLFDPEEGNFPANPDAAKFTAYDVDRLDMGNSGPAQMALLEKFRYLDTDILAGWYLAPLQAAEAKFGARAMASVHADANITYSELIHAAILEQLNAGPVRTMCQTNWGEAEAGRYYFEASPLADPTQQFLQEIAKALAAAPGDPFGQQIDRRALAKRVEVPVDENYRPVPPLPDGTPGMPGDQQGQVPPPNASGPESDLSGISNEELFAHAQALLKTGNPPPGVNGNGRKRRMGIR